MKEIKNNRWAIHGEVWKLAYEQVRKQVSETVFDIMNLGASRKLDHVVSISESMVEQHQSVIQSNPSSAE